MPCDLEQLNCKESYGKGSSAFTKNTKPDYLGINALVVK
jgi:hypothetical protein